MLNNREGEEFCLNLQGSRGLSCIEDRSGREGVSGYGGACVSLEIKHSANRSRGDYRPTFATFTTCTIQLL